MANASIFDFTLGLMSGERVPENKMPYGVLTVLQNASVDRGRVISYPKLDKIWTFNPGNILQGSIQNPIGDGFYLAVSRDLYYGTLDGGLVLLRSNIFSGVDRVSMSILNNKMFCCDGVSEPVLYDIDVSGTVVDVPIVKDAPTWFLKKPIYSYVLFSRMWVILKDGTELWCSTLDDPSNWTIPVSPSADSANVFVSSSLENTHVSIIAGLDALIVFKKRGIDFVLPGNNNLLDITDYTYIESIGNVSTFNAYTTVNMLNTVYTVGPFGLQSITREAITNRLSVNNLASYSSPHIQNGFPPDMDHCTLLSSQDSSNLYFDLKQGFVNEVVQFSIEKDTIVSSLSIPGIRLIERFVDSRTRTMKYIIAYSNQVWITNGEEGYPGGAITMRIKTPNHAIARGSVFKGGKVKIRGKALDTAVFKSYWNDESLPTDQYTLDGYTVNFGKYGDPYGTVKYAGNTESQIFYQTLPLFGRGDQVSLEILLLIGLRDAIIDRIEIQTSTKGFTQNG